MNRKERRAAQKAARGGGPSAGEAILAQALQHHQAGRLEPAIAAYREVVRRDPDHGHAQFNLGNLLAARGELGEAERAFENALRIQSKSAVAPGSDYAAIFLELGNLQRGR